MFRKSGCRLPVVGCRLSINGRPPVICVRTFCGAAAVIALSFLPIGSLQAAQSAKSQAGQPATGNRQPTTVLSGSDIMATVEGHPITRRELTYFWISTDRQAGHLVGDLLVDRWRAARGSMPYYSIPEAAIYARLYSGSSKDSAYANMLSNMVTTRLVEIEAKRKHITVMPQEARAAAHEMLEEVRQQQHLTLKDDEILVQFGIPRDLFMDDMVFRVRLERLLQAEYVRRNGHALTADDRANWKQTMEAQKAEYLTRLRHNAHITSVVPLPEPTAAPQPQEANGAGMPPPPPDLKH